MKLNSKSKASRLQKRKQEGPFNTSTIMDSRDEVEKPAVVELSEELKAELGSDDVFVGWNNQLFI